MERNASLCSMVHKKKSEAVPSVLKYFDLSWFRISVQVQVYLVCLKNMHLLCPPFFQIFYYFSGVRQKIPLFVLFLTLCEQSAPLSYSLVTQSEPLPTAKCQSLFSFSRVWQRNRMQRHKKQKKLRDFWILNLQSTLEQPFVTWDLWPFQQLIYQNKDSDKNIPIYIEI